jgi:hypothetical protein
MKKFLAAASLLVSVASAAHDGEEAPRVIPGSGDRNARFVIKGKEIDGRLPAGRRDQRQDAGSGRPTGATDALWTAEERLPREG